MNDREYEDIVAYNNILDYTASDNTNDESFWKFKRIIAHQGPLNTTHPDYKGSCYNVMVQWETGETTAKPLSVFTQDAQLSVLSMPKRMNFLRKKVGKG